MKRVTSILFLACALGLSSVAFAQGMGSITKGGDFILKGGLSHWALFDDIGGGSGLFYVGAERPFSNESNFTASADVQFSTIGNRGFFYMGTAGVRYYLTEALNGLNAGAWAVYDDGSLGAGAKLGYQIPAGRVFLDLGAGPAYIGGAGGGGTFLMSTASIGFRFGGEGE